MGPPRISILQGRKRGWGRTVELTASAGNRPGSQCTTSKWSYRRVRWGGRLSSTVWLSETGHTDRKSTRLNSSHLVISYAVFCLKKITLTTDRADIAHKILPSFARSIDGGSLPNKFPDAGGRPEYNPVDAALWFFEFFF